MPSAPAAAGGSLVGRHGADRRQGYPRYRRHGVVTLKKNRPNRLSAAWRTGLELKDPHRYRVRTLPAAGALLRPEDTGEQMSLL